MIPSKTHPHPHVQKASNGVRTHGTPFLSRFSVTNPNERVHLIKEAKKMRLRLYLRSLIRRDPVPNSLCSKLKQILGYSALSSGPGSRMGHFCSNLFDPTLPSPNLQNLFAPQAVCECKSPYGKQSLRIPFYWQIAFTKLQQTVRYPSVKHTVLFFYGENAPNKPFC